MKAASDVCRIPMPIAQNAAGSALQEHRPELFHGLPVGWTARDGLQVVSDRVKLPSCQAAPRRGPRSRPLGLQAVLRHPVRSPRPSSFQHSASFRGNVTIQVSAGKGWVLLAVCSRAGRWGTRSIEVLSWNAPMGRVRRRTSRKRRSMAIEAYVRRRIKTVIGGERMGKPFENSICMSARSGAGEAE